MPADAQELWDRRHTLRVLSELELDGGVAWTRKAAPVARLPVASSQANANKAHSARDHQAVDAITGESTGKSTNKNPDEEPLIAASEPVLPPSAQFIFLTTDAENPLLEQPLLADLFDKILGHAAESG